MSGSGDQTPSGPLSGSSDQTPSQSWVQFDGEENGEPKSSSPTPPVAAPLPPPPSKKDVVTPALIGTTDVQVNLATANGNGDRNGDRNNHKNTNGNTKVQQPIETPLTSPHYPTEAPPLQTIPLGEPQAVPPASTQRGSIRQGFANGDVIVTLLPQNTSMAWITPAHFRPELVPEELMAQGLTLTVEDYVHVMTQLVNDNRFKLFNICYKRVVIAWIILGFLILLSILFFSKGRQLELFGAGIAWLLINAVAIFLCMWLKIKLNRGLEQCLAGINQQLMKHKILLGLDDRGKLSCHKVNLCFIYFDPKDCLSKLQQLIEEDARAVASADGGADSRPPLHTRLDIDDPDIIISGATTTRISREQERSKSLYARYTQRWVKAVSRGRLALSIDTPYRNNGAGPSLNPPPSRIVGVSPRHASTLQCPCQFIEEHINYKPTGCFGVCDQWNYSNGVVQLPPSRLLTATTSSGGTVVATAPSATSVPIIPR